MVPARFIFKIIGETAGRTIAFTLQLSARSQFGALYSPMQDRIGYIDHKYRRSALGAPDGMRYNRNP
jgi:hypothetical protein